jgi:hypothetical protein
MIYRFYNLCLLVTVWRYVFVADFEALTCQVTRKFIRCKNPETRTIPAIKYTACYQLGVLVYQRFEINFQFYHSNFLCLKRFSFFSVGKVSGGRQTSYFAIFGLCIGLCELQMCLAVWDDYSFFIYLTQLRIIALSSFDSSICCFSTTNSKTK